MPSAVIFDLDGTLVDTITDIANAVNAALSARGHPVHDEAAYRRMVGNGFRNLVRAALPEEARSEDRIETLNAEASEAYRAHLLDNTLPYPGVRNLLTGLGRLGVPMAILSNKPDALVKRIAMALFPEADFAFVRGDSPAFPRKPAPDQALDLARRLDLEPADIVYLGDSDVDMLMAKSAGMVAVGAGWGFRGPAELEAAGAEQILAEPAGLLALFGK